MQRAAGFVAKQHPTALRKDTTIMGKVRRTVNYRRSAAQRRSARTFKFSDSRDWLKLASGSL